MSINIESLWKEMENTQDYVFYTTTGLPFTIKKRNDNYFNVYRGDKKLGSIKKENMKFVINNPYNNTTFCKNKMFCASYALPVYSKICEEK